MGKTIDNNTIEAHERDYLYVANSQLVDAGNGLFTAINIYKDETIALFTGELLSDEEAKERAQNNKNGYFIKLLSGSILDSMNTECFAKYANDATGFEGSLLKNNAKIALNEDNNVCLTAIRRIKAGEEILCSYGKSYWKHRK